MNYNLVFATHPSVSKQYLFQAPADVALHKGETVTVNTKRGEQPATVSCESFLVCEEVARAIVRVNGSGGYFPPAMVTGYIKTTSEPFTAPAPKEDKPEPIKLYCVKDYSNYLKRGKIYEWDGEKVNYDNIEPATLKSLEDWKRGGRSFAERLFPLVLRHAKVGEWVYITDAHAGFSDDGSRLYKDGDIRQMASDNYVSTPKWGNRKDFLIDPREYLVLDGYDGRYEEPEKPKYCSSCSNLCVIDNPPVYAYCKTKKKVFESWKDGARTQSCENWTKGEA